MNWDEGAAGMDGTSAAAHQHICQMEARIARQTALIVELRQSGQDTLEAARRLALLHHALEEMRFLIGDMLPTETRANLRSAI
jgi:hypothetical protein